MNKKDKVVSELNRVLADMQPKPITRASILAQLGHHRTSLDDILNNLNIRAGLRSKFRFVRKLKYACRLVKFGVIVIYLLWTKKVSGHDGDYWITD